MITGRHKIDLIAVDFPHLSERVMLYVVFTFGEMIIAISGYFSGSFTPTSAYYALCAFLIVVGLFMSYGYLYDHLLDRDMSINGNRYMLIHIVIIFALSNLTSALEFMHEPSIPLAPKSIYITISFVLYYVFIFLLVPYTKGFNGRLKGFWKFAAALAAFVVLSIFAYRFSAISIALAVLLTFYIWNLEYRYKQQIIDKQQAWKDQLTEE